MLVDLFWTVFPVITSIAAGFIYGKYYPRAIGSHVGKLIALLVWLLLLTIGFEFGEVFSSAHIGVSVFKIALSYALVISGFICVTLSIYARWVFPNTSLPTIQSNNPTSPYLFQSGFLLRSNFFQPIKECLFALSAIALGTALFYLSHRYQNSLTFTFESNYLLYVLLFVIGLDSSHFEFDRTWFSRNILAVPLIVILASLAAACVLSPLQNIPLKTSLALSSGFGWFSLSGVLVGKQLSSFYGSIVLLIDLLRELIGICFLYVAGKRLPTASIGICGATALDTTLGIIKKTSGNDYIKLAMISGAVTSLCAPFLILLFLNL